MKITAIVSEYNPFHNGHKYLIDRARENGATHIAAIMGGNFLQRGECAVVDKFHRSKAAVLGGVDIVLELPVIYACSSAEKFAGGAVETLEKCGCIDELCFGAECDDTQKLSDAAELTCSDELISLCRDYVKQGYSHPRAMQAAAENFEKSEKFKGAAELLTAPNNTLAIEYIRALKNFNSSIKPFAVARKSVDHNSSLTLGSFASASAVREMIISKKQEYREFVPSTTYDIINQCVKSGECPAQAGNGDRALFAVLRQMTADDLSKISDVTEGLENRIIKHLKESRSVDELISRVKSKRYTYSRLSRVITCAYLGITKELASAKPQYIRVLSCNERGTELLSLMKKSASLPLVISPAKDKEKLSPLGRQMLEKDILATDLYGLMTPEVIPCSKDYSVRLRADNYD